MTPLQKLKRDLDVLTDISVFLMKIAVLIFLFAASSALADKLFHSEQESAQIIDVR